VVQVDNQILYN